MYKILKKVFKWFFLKCGLNVTLTTNVNFTYKSIEKAMDYNGINMLIDIGANVGQFSSMMRYVGYSKSIISFEPLQNEWHELNRISKKDPNWKVFERCALGSVNCESYINKSANSVSSSLMPILISHVKASPNSFYIDKQLTKVLTLDSILQTQNTLFAGKEILLKIDTQGYELEILKGASKFLNITKGILVELSLIELYEGQVLWGELITEIEAMGFKLWSFYPGFSNPDDGKTYQVDALFFRN